MAIVGPTGCGKSTLLNVAAGLLLPSAGDTCILGAPLMGLNQAAGYLLQQDALMPWKTARDNVAIGLEVGGTPRRRGLAAGRAVAKNVGLAAFGDRYPHQLSGGQKKRVGLAQVLIRDPKILLMDEPFGPLDAQTRQIMGNLLLDLWAADRKAVLFITHDLEEAIALADRVLIMSAGPEASVIGDYRIDLDRPRDASEIRLLPRFHELHKAIWIELQRRGLEGLRRSRRMKLSRSGLLMLQILVAVVLIGSGTLAPACRWAAGICSRILLFHARRRRAAGVDFVCRWHHEDRHLPGEHRASAPAGGFRSLLWQNRVAALVNHADGGAARVCHRRGCRRGVRLLVGAQPAAVGDL